jgi:hypothetical protein
VGSPWGAGPILRLGYDFVATKPAGAVFISDQFLPIDVPFEEIAQSARSRMFERLEHQRRAYWALSLFPTPIKETNNLTLLVPAEAEFPITNADEPKIGVGLNDRFHAQTVRG